MKTRMKKLISISTIPVLALALLLVLGTVLQAKKPAPSLTGTTEYWFVGHLGETDDEGRLLCWKGTISGDINGVIKSWMPPGTATGQVLHWVERWETWNADETKLLMAGYEEGTSTAPPGKDGIWRGNGIVTEASEEFEQWIGRQVHDEGDYTWQEIETPDGPITIPDHGFGTSRIN